MKGQDIPIYVMDAETDPFKAGRIPRPFLWGLYGEGQYHERPHSEVDELLELVIWQKCIVYAHNGGRFDWHLLPKQYFHSGMELMIINGRIAKFKIGEAEFRDSYSILPVPLAAYKKDAIDYAIFEPGERSKPKNKRLISEYLRSDCLYLYDIIQKFIKSYGLNLTMAGASMKQWAKISRRDKPKSTKEFYDSFKKYYYGGRVQCFKHGDILAPMQMRDIRSAYPDQMRNPHPFSLEYESNAGGIEAESFYTVRAVAAGCFPIRDAEGKLRFPNDKTRRAYHVTGHELIAAQETDAVKELEIVESFHFLTCIDFRDYIDKFYALRMEAKRDEKRAAETGDQELADDAAARSLFAKLFMNSLYGKFGANPENYKNYRLCEAEELPLFDGSLERHGWTGSGTWGEFGIIERPLPDEQQRFYNVATAASITGSVRAKLWRALSQAKQPIYCDTDAIVAKGLDHCPLGPALGEWDLVGNFDRALIAGKKMYALRNVLKDKDGKTQWKIATKGARLTWQEIARICKGREVVYMPDAPTFSPHHVPRFTSRRIRATE